MINILIQQLENRIKILENDAKMNDQIKKKLIKEDRMILGLCMKLLDPEYVETVVVPEVFKKKKHKPVYQQKYKEVDEDRFNRIKPDVADDADPDRFNRDDYQPPYVPRRK